MGAADLEIRLLGRFAARRGDEEISPAAFGGRLSRAMVRLLLTRRGESVSKDVLAEALWGERQPADPAANLDVLVSRARRALGDPSLIVASSGGFSFAGGEAVRVDAEVVLARRVDGRAHLAAGRTSAAGRAFREALEAWGGEPLPEDAYADWAQPFRTALLRAHLDALEGAASAALALRDPAQAVTFAEQAVVREPLREAAHLLLIEALAAAGDQAAALDAYDSFRGRFAEELGLDPSPAAEALQAKILRGEVGAPLARATQVAVAEELPFVGREDERAAILEGVQAGANVLVPGPAGSGKSRLLHEIAALMRLPMLGVRAFPAERDEPWNVAREVVRETLSLDVAAVQAVPGRAAAALAEIVPEIAELRALPELALDPQSRRSLALEAAARIVTAAVPEGFVLVLDDAQWADATSLALIELAARRVPGLRVVVAYRSDEIHETLESFLASVRATRETREVRPAPLSAEALEALFGNETLAGVVATHTDRTPLAVSEVVRALARDGMLVADAGGRWRPRSELALEAAEQAARAGQRRAIESRAGLLSPRRREVLVSLALLGREAPARIVSRAIGVGQRAALDDLEALARAGLARAGSTGWAVAHDVIGETLASAVTPEQRARVHAMLAGALEAEGAEVSEIARHLAGGGDRDAASRAFAEAAEAALARYADEETLERAEAGLALDPAAEIRIRLLGARAEALARRGELGPARDDLRIVLSMLPEGPRRSRVLSRTAMLAAGSEDYGLGGELVDLAISEAGVDASARAEALAVGAIVDLNLGSMPRSEQRSEEALRLFERLGDAHGAAGILDGRAMATFLQGRILEAIDRFDRVARLFAEAGELLRVPTPRSTRGHALVFAGRPDEALKDVEQALDLERMLGHPEGEAYCLWHRAESLAALGRADAAVAAAEEALSIAERIGHREWTVASLRGLGIAASAAGDLDRAEGAFRRSLEESRRMPLFASWAAARLASTLLAAGRTEEAAPLVERALAEGTPLSFYEARLAQAELAAAAGRSDASRLAREALASAEAGGHFASVGRLRELAEG